MRGRKPNIDEMTGFIAAHPRLVEATRIQSTNNRITHEKFGAPGHVCGCCHGAIRDTFKSNSSARAPPIPCRRKTFQTGIISAPRAL
jgi:hypothetical protein